MVNAERLRSAILASKCNAEFQVRHADAVFDRARRLDTFARISIASLAIMLAFVPGNLPPESTWIVPWISGTAAFFAVAIGMAEWRDHMLGAMAERERWTPIALDYEQLLLELDTVTEPAAVEAVAHEWRQINQRAIAASSMPVSLPNWPGLRKTAADSVRQANAHQGSPA